jgi:hypothetical protein
VLQLKLVLFGFTNKLSIRRQLIFNNVFNSPSIRRERISITDTFYIETSGTGDLVLKIEFFRADLEMLEELLEMVSLISNSPSICCTEVKPFSTQEEEGYSLYLTYPISEHNFTSDLYIAREDIKNIGSLKPTFSSIKESDIERDTQEEEGLTHLDLIEEQINSVFKEMKNRENESKNN